MPKHATDIDGVRWYRNPNQPEKGWAWRSVTNVTGALPKPALLKWAAKATAEFAVEQLEAWQHMPAFEAVDWLKTSPWRTRDRAALSGSAGHSIIEAILKGEDVSVEEQVQPKIASARRFIEDYRPRPLRLETSVYSDRHMIAGTFDFLGTFDQAPELGVTLVDWKFGNGVYKDMAVQVGGAYALTSEYILTDEGEQIPWTVPDNAVLVHFTVDGYVVRPIVLDNALRRAFLACIEIRRWEQESLSIGRPYQLRLEVDGPPLSKLPTDSALAAVLGRLNALSLEQKADVAATAKEAGIATKKKQITTDDLDRLAALISVYEMGTPIDEQQTTTDDTTGRRVSRPMP